MMTKSLFQQILLSSLLALGAAGVCAMVGPWMIELLPAVSNTVNDRDSVAFVNDGEPLLLRYVGEPVQAEYHDLQGKLVVPPSAEDRVMPIPLPTTWPPSGLTGSPRLSDGQPSSTFWYLLENDVADDGIGYFVGYDSQSKLCIGYLGLDGFSTKVPTRETMIPGIHRGSDGIRPDSEKGLYILTPQNQVMYQNIMMPGFGVVPPAVWQIYIPSGDGSKLHLADLKARTVKTVYDGAAIRSAAVMLKYVDARGTTAQHLAVRTDESVLVLELDGAIKHRFPIPASLRNEDFAMGLTNKGNAVMEWSSPTDSLSSTTYVRVFHIQPDGQANETDLTLETNAFGRPYQVYGGLVNPSPAFILYSLGFDRVSELMRQRLTSTFGEAVQRTAVEYGPTFLLAMMISLLLAGICYFRLARYRASRTERIVWPLFVLVFGLPGWIGYRFGRTWPVLESCSVCTTRSPRDREECVACGTEFEAPAELGTEVFA